MRGEFCFTYTLARGNPNRSRSGYHHDSARQARTGTFALIATVIRRERVTATLDGEFVVFLIGMRINRPLMVHKWLPVAKAMGRMLGELHRHPELGFVHAESWFGRTIILVQYWRSMGQLLAYAKNRNAEHLPAWRAFNQAIGTDGSVGIWHETYHVAPGRYENIYVNMPPFGLGKAGSLIGVSGARESASGRLDSNKTGS